MFLSICFLFAVVILKHAKNCTGLNALIDIGFDESIKLRPGAVDICSTADNQIQSCVNPIVFTQTFEEFKKNFTQFYTQNLQNLAKKGNKIYRQGTQMIARMLDDQNYNKLFALKKSFIPFSDEKSLKEQAQALLEDKKCLNVQLEILLYAWCILSGTEAVNMLQNPAKTVLEIQGSLVKEAVENCSQNIEFMCNFEDVWIGLGKHPEKSVGPVISLENCKKFVVWRNCVDTNKDCLKEYESVFESFFSPAKLLITNAAREEASLPGREARKNSENSNEWNYSVSKNGFTFIKNFFRSKSSQLGSYIRNSSVLKHLANASEQTSSFCKRSWKAFKDFVTFKSSQLIFCSLTCAFLLI